MKTPILGSSYVARSVNAADSRMVNLFPEIVPEGGKEPAFLNRAPGLRKLVEVGTGPIRGLWQANGQAFAVSGEAFYAVNADWTCSYIGDVSGSGPVSMADNGAQIFIACNPRGYIYNVFTGAFKEITDPDFPGAVTVTYLDGYFVFNEPNSQRIWVTSLLDGSTINPLDYASAEGSPDNVVSLIADHGELWLLGSNSVEVWYDAGGADFPLARIPGAYNEIGCIAPYSAAKQDNAIFWLGADARGRGTVYRSKGYGGVRISTHAVEWRIQQYANLDQTIGYTYQQDGHSFYVLVFPEARTTWVYDVATEVWHERASWQGGAWARHRGNCQMSFNSEIVIGDYINGNLYAFDLYDYSDNGETQRWLRSWRALPTGQNNLKRTIHHNLQLDCEVGVGITGYYESSGYLLTQSDEVLSTEDGLKILSDLPTSPAVDPQVMLRWSDDGGHTWSNERWQSMGKAGQFGKRVVWRRLGATMAARDRVYEIAGTAPVKITIMGAELQLSPTNA